MAHHALGVRAWRLPPPPKIHFPTATMAVLAVAVTSNRHSPRQTATDWLSSLRPPVLPTQTAAELAAAGVLWAVAVGG
jgi:hypothetical protein